MTCVLFSLSLSFMENQCSRNTAIVEQHDYVEAGREPRNNTTCFPTTMSALLADKWPLDRKWPFDTLLVRAEKLFNNTDSFNLTNQFRHRRQFIHHKLIT